LNQDVLADWIQVGLREPDPRRDFTHRIRRSDQMIVGQAHHAAAEADPETATPLRAGEEILECARAIAPRLRERSPDIERERQLPPDVVAMLRNTGVFRMGFARSWGGPELNSIQQTEVIEALSYGDAAAGWCAMIGSDTGLYAAFLDEPVAKEMFPSLDMIIAGLLFPTGRAERTAGGYRLTGRWQFGSGVTHADWVVSGAFIYRDGEPESSPSGDPHDSRLMMVPREQVEIVDTWYTTGLAGTGSCDYTITDVFVPEEHTLTFDTVRNGVGPLAHPEVHMRNMPGVPLGVARAALDHVREIACSRVHPASGTRADDYRTQATLANCEADFVATRSGVYGSMKRQHDVLAAGGTLDDLTPDERAALPLSRLHAFRTARAIVSRLYDLLQTTSIYQVSPLDRWLRDTTTMCQHIVAQDRILQSAGAYLLGGKPDFPLCLGIVGQAARSQSERQLIVRTETDVGQSTFLGELNIVGTVTADAPRWTFAISQRHRNPS
jgi:indole-3-acetate monooxygenase